MHWLKIAVLTVAVLAVMRAASWSIEWLLLRQMRGSRRAAAVLANVAAFGLFAGYLAYNLLPSEPMDLEALLFGLAVFGCYALIDLRWTPWRRSTGS